MNTSFLPLSPEALTKIKPADVRYLEGHPRAYRFDAKDGRFFDHNGDPIAKSGDSLTIVPLSYRIFIAEMFEYSRRTWLEIFFLNAANQVCSMLMHGYSTQEFELATAELFYEEAAVNEITLEILPMQKEKLLEDGKKFKYFIAEFKITKLKPAQAKQPAAIIQELPPVYRKSTAAHPGLLLAWLNYPSAEELPAGLLASPPLPEALPEEATTES